MTRVIGIVLWLAFGHAFVFGLYWALLQVPEARVWMLALSAILALLIVVSTAIVEATAIAWWQGDSIQPPAAPPVRPGPGPSVPSEAADTVRLDSVRPEPVEGRTAPLWRRASALPSPSRWRRALALPSLTRALTGFIIAALIFLLFYWLTDWVGTWWADHRGEIDAWMMMRTRSPRTAWLHTFVNWLIRFVRYPVALSLAVGFFGEWLQGTARARPLRWVRAAIGWRPLVGLSIALFIFIYLPWRYVYWRPESLPASWLEPAFVSVKLFLVYMLMNTGWAVALSAGARDR